MSCLAWNDVGTHRNARASVFDRAAIFRGVRPSFNGSFDKLKCSRKTGFYADTGTFSVANDILGMLKTIFGDVCNPFY